MNAAKDSARVADVMVLLCKGVLTSNEVDLSTKPIFLWVNTFLISWDIIANYKHQCVPWQLIEPARLAAKTPETVQH